MEFDSSPKSIKASDEKGSEKKESGIKFLVSPSNSEKKKGGGGHAWTHILFEAGFEYADKKRSGRDLIYQHHWLVWRNSFDPTDWDGSPLSTKPIVHTIPDMGHDRDNEGKSKLTGFVTRLAKMKKVLQMENVLSKKECAECVTAAESVGFMDVADIAALDFPEYSPVSVKERDNTARVMLVEDAGLALLLWERIRHVVMEHLPVITYSDNYAEQTVCMHAVGVCSLMRVLKYETGQQFKAHTDGVDYTKTFQGSRLMSVNESEPDSPVPIRTAVDEIDMAVLSVAVDGDADRKVQLGPDSHSSAAGASRSRSNSLTVDSFDGMSERSGRRSRSGSISASGKHIRHAGSMCCRRGKFRSGLTLALYLNTADSSAEDSEGKRSTGEFGGGSIRFLQPPRLVQPGSAEVTPETPALSKVYTPYPGQGVEIGPSLGQGLLFEQDEHHEGLPLTHGTKYMIQTSIMYELDE